MTLVTHDTHDNDRFLDEKFDFLVFIRIFAIGNVEKIWLSV